MKYFISISILLLALCSCVSQQSDHSTKIVGGPCEGCEAIHEYGNKKLTAIDTLPDFQSQEPKLQIKGTVYQSDGTTPAKNVILYIYHTDREGLYPKKGNEVGWARRHGYIQGWIKTGNDGMYTFYTFRPAAYPNGQESEHIHITVKEPNKNEYYIDEYVFEDDPLLTPSARRSLPNRGGSGIVMPQIKKGILSVERDIILGLNIPNYK